MGHETNIRSDLMFEIIKDNLPFRDGFKNKSVIDLGCGYGDLLALSLRAGAASVVGVDASPESIRAASKKLANLASKLNNVDYRIRQADINVEANNLYKLFGKYDIAYCTSVLPYIENREEVLEYLSRHAFVTFLEIQYHGDGPGLSKTPDEQSAKEWFEEYWVKVKRIGSTYTGRVPRSERDIWRCIYHV